VRDGGVALSVIEAAGAAVTIKLRPVLLVRLPLVPVTVSGYVPAAADPTVNVSVEALALLVGLNAAVTPVGSPVTPNETVPAKPPLGVTVIADVPFAPCVTDTADGLAERLKLAAGWTFRITVVVREPTEALPLIVNVYDPAGTVPPTVKVSVDVVAVDAGLNAAVTALGSPPMLSATSPVNPPLGVTVIVEEPFPPCVAVTDDGLADSEKSGVATALQPGSENEATRVLQLKVPVVFRY